MRSVEVHNIKSLTVTDSANNPSISFVAKLTASIFILSGKRHRS